MARRGAVNTDDLPNETDAEFEDGDNQRPPTPDEDSGDASAEITRPDAARTTVSDDPQGAFGDVIVNVEDEEGVKLLKLFEVRQKNQKANQTFNAADRDIKKAMVERGHYNGQPINVRIGHHLFSLAATSDEKSIDAFTRSGSQRKNIKHPE